MKTFIIFSIIILALGAGLVGFWYTQTEKNTYSKETLKLEILSSDKIEAGKEIEYTIKYKNNGNIRLEEPILIFEYPEHSFVENNKPLRQEVELKDIYPGEERTITFKARLFGNEDDSKNARAWLSYSPKNLKVRYESETSFTTIIEKTPIVFEFDLLTKIESAKEIRFRINYFSNINFPLSDVRCVIEYPDDFEFIESHPKALEEIEWEIGLLNKADGGRIEIVGKLLGEVGEQKTFKAKIGMWQDGEFVLLKEAIKGVEIIEPSLYISQTINGNPEYVANSGDMLHYEIFFKNIGEEQALTDMFLIAKLDSKMFDFETLKSPKGAFETGDNSIVWDWRRVSGLRFLDAQEEEKVEFWIELKDGLDSISLGDKNSVLRNKVYLSQAREEFLTKVNSKLVIEQKVYFEDEVFGNSGPIPPKAGETTFYTVMWQIKNYYNDIEDVKVKAILPKQVKLTGELFPEDSKITFDSVSKEIVWEIGDIEAGAGVLADGKSCAFQVAFRPDSAQKGNSAQIIGDAKILANDNHTEQAIEAESFAVDTTLPDDETITQEQGIIR